MVRRQVGRAGPLRDQLVPRAVELPADRVADDQHPLGAVEGGAVLVAFLHVGRPDPLLEDQLLARPGLAVVGVLEDDVLRVGELLVVVEEVLAAQAGDPASGASSTPRPQQATSMSWTPSLPMSPEPKSYHQRQMPGSRFGRYGTHRRGAAARGRSRARPAARLGCVLPMSPRRWLFQALATSTSPIAPPRSRCDRLADDGACCGSACRPGARLPDRVDRLDQQPALRGCCGSTASRRRRACRRRRARIAAGACQWSGVAIQTASTPLVVEDLAQVLDGLRGLARAVLDDLRRARPGGSRSTSQT